MASNEFQIAVIGIACRTPRCENASQFWQFLRDKKQSLASFPSNRAKDIDHLLQNIVPDDFKNPNQQFFPGSYFDSIDKFDANFFGISPTEAIAMDPQHRMFMQTAWEAIEDAGLASQIYGSETGVYTGDTTNKYSRVLEKVDTNAIFGTLPQMIPSRLSYTFDLRGPTMVVAVGCSSSLLSVHLACQGLRCGDCKVAIAGGVTIDSSPINEKSDLWNLVELLNPNDQVECSPFDENAKGYVKGEGCSIVVLKPLAEAIKDGNHIYGVIAGSAANQKARGNGIVTPNPKGLCDVTVEAWRRAAVDAGDIDYYEASGSSKISVDVVEMTGIQMAFDRSKNRGFVRRSKDEKPCLGAVTANVCHLVEGAAGVTSLIKVLLALKHETIPPQINFKTPNKMINWEKCPVRINTEAVDWKVKEGKPRVASVSSFGTSGTNVHVVVRDFKPETNRERNTSGDIMQPILLSAATQSSLKNFVDKLRSYLSTTRNLSDSMFFDDLVYTLNIGRDHKRLNLKSLIFAKNIEELSGKLEKLSHYLNSCELKPVTANDIQSLMEISTTESFLCFAIDPKLKLKASGLRRVNENDLKWVSLIESIINRSSINWEAFQFENRSMLPMLPTYCFDEQRFWPNIVHKSASNKGNGNSESESFSFCSIPPKDCSSPQNEAKSLVDEITQDNISNELRKALSSVCGLVFDDWERCKSYTLLDIGIDADVMIEIFNLLTLHFQVYETLTSDEFQRSSSLGEILQLVSKKLLNCSKTAPHSTPVLKIFTSTTAFLKTSFENVFNFSQELLLENNLFKINNNMVDMNGDAENECVIVSLNSKSQSLGIVAVVVFKIEEPNLVVNQWVLSNAALGMNVDSSILRHLKIISEKSGCNTIRVQINGHEGNRCTLNFLRGIGFKLVQSENSSQWMTCCLSELPNLYTNRVIHVDSPDSMITCSIRKTTKSFHMNSEILKHEPNVNGSDNRTRANRSQSDESFDSLSEDISNLVSENSATNALSDIWFDVLGVRPTNTTHFFHCGGTSLKAVNFVSQVREKLELDLRLSHIYRKSTFGEVVNLMKSLDSIRRLVPLNFKSEEVKLSSTQAMILSLQEKAISSTAYVESIALFGSFRDFASKTLLKSVLEHFPLLTSVIEKNKDGEKVFSTLSIDQIIESSILDTVVVDTKQSAILKAQKLHSCLPFKNGEPLIKLLVIEVNQKSDGNKMVVLFIHRLLIDDVSLSQVENFLLQILNGVCLPRGPGTKTFDDFKLIEKQYFTSDTMQRDLETFSQSFEKIQSITSLGFSSEMWTNMKTYDCESKYREIDLNIRKVCSLLDIQPFHFFLSCYLLTLKRYAAEDDLLTCIPINTRSPSFKDSFGPFENKVLYRFSVNPEMDIKTFIQNVASKWLHLQDINLLPLEKVLSYLRDDKKIADVSISNTFNYTTVRKSKSSLYIPPLHVKEPFALTVQECSSATFAVKIEWSPNFVDSDVAENFGESFVRICEKLASNFCDMKREPVGQIDVMSDVERKTIIGFNRPLTSIPNLMVAKYFENNCKLNGHKTAVYCDENSLTYNQLNSMANSIASFLQRTVSEDDLQSKPIVVMMKRSEVLIATILAIWKVGGFVLTISEDMQQHFIQLCNKQKYKFDLLLTNLSSEQIHIKIPERIKVVNVTGTNLNNSSADFKCNLNNRDPKTTIAYMFLTSGTTGEPKCCLITHFAFSLIIEAIVTDYQLNTFKVNMLQTSPVSFDAFLAEFAIGLLSVCGSLTIAEKTSTAEVDKLRNLIAARNVSCCLLTPQASAMVFLDMPKSALKHFRLLITGGEECPVNLYQKLNDKLTPGIRIVNAYGMTETSIISTNFHDSLRYSSSSSIVPIGRPVTGVNIFIVDPISKLLSPIGTPGELCICGPVVGKGDVKSETLGIAGEAPVYMTGDKARWLPDGNVDYIGREKLTFYKVNGLRVNIREIETVVDANLKSKIDETHVFAAEDRLKQNIFCLVYKPKPGFDTDDLDKEIRHVIKSQLPFYMMPNVIKPVKQIPLTASGKTDLRSLRKLCLKEKQPENEVEPSDNHASPTESMLLEYLMLSLPYETPIDVKTNFRDQGIHSLSLVKFAEKLLAENVPGFDGVADLFDFPNLNALAKKIDASRVTATKTNIPSPLKAVDDSKVAIVGVALRLPKNISTITEFANALLQKQCFVDEFPTWRTEDYLTRLNSDDYRKMIKMKTFKAAFLNEIDKFDNEFFDILKTEAEHMCVEQRLWMEVATEALADSGHISTVRGSRTGVFVSSSNVKYGAVDSSSETISVVGKMASFIPTRLAYHFDLKGPTVSVDTACSSGIVALHQACEAIKSGLCDAAVVGGASVYMYPSKDGTYEDKMMTLAPDSCCRAFDAKANGAVPGEGVIAFIIEPLKKAIENNRFIYGVIESTMINSVGRGNGITAPSVSSQKELITGAINAASLSTQDINLIETHGTGTQLGDTIELTALKAVFKENNKPVFLGATKPSFGHLNEASGFLGILKILATMITKEIPATVNFSTPNRVLNESKLIVPTTSIKLKTDEFIAGVSSLGLAGTNTHVILSRRKHHETSSIASSQSNLKSNPLLIRCNSFSQFQKQIKEYYAYISEMIVKWNVTSISELIASVCRILKSTEKKRKQSENFRIVLMLEDEEQALRLLSKLSNITEDELNRMAVKDKNVVISATGANHGIDSFIRNGCILDSFVDQFQPLRNSPCVPVMFFQSIRHWPEKQSQSALENNEIEDQVHEDTVAVNRTAKSFDEVITDLREIWKSVLGVEEVEEDDIFIDLGGESLLIIDMMQRVRKEIGVQLDLGLCYAYPSLKQLAVCVKSLIDECC